MRHLCGVVLLLAGSGLVAGGAACGGSSSSGQSLDCAYLTGDNCWKATASGAAACLPAQSEVGTLSADGKTCTYASGAVVTFAAPLVLPLPEGSTPSWNFTVTGADGQSCLAYKDDASAGIALTVQGQTVKEGPSGGLGIALTCPDGSRYSSSNALQLLSCPDAGLLGGLPGEAWSGTDTSVSLSLLATSTGADNGLSVFNCQKAP